MEKSGGALAEKNSGVGKSYLDISKIWSVR